jgi:hypothetical protein
MLMFSLVEGTTAESQFNVTVQDGAINPFPENLNCVLTKAASTARRGVGLFCMVEGADRCSCRWHEPLKAS